MPPIRFNTGLRFMVNAQDGPGMTLENDLRRPRTAIFVAN